MLTFEPLSFCQSSQRGRKMRKSQKTKENTKNLIKYKVEGDKVPDNDT